MLGGGVGWGGGHFRLSQAIAISYLLMEFFVFFFFFFWGEGGV